MPEYHGPCQMQNWNPDVGELIAGVSGVLPQMLPALGIHS